MKVADALYRRMHGIKQADPQEAELGFDVSAIGTFTLAQPNPAVPPRLDIFTVPKNYSYAIVDGLTVNGDPPGVFYNQVSWGLAVSNGAATAMIVGSRIAGVVQTPAGAGLRWVVMGSLQEPAPVRIRIGQDKILQVVIVASSAPANTPVTLYCRARGAAYQ